MKHYGASVTGLRVDDESLTGADIADGSIELSDLSPHVQELLTPAYYATSQSAPFDYPLTANNNTSGVSVTDMDAGVYFATCSIQYATLPLHMASACSDALTSLINQVLGEPGGVAHVPAYTGVITPGVYDTAGATTHTGVIEYDAQGDPDAMFIIRCSAAHAVAAAASVVLVNGAQAQNIVWLVVGAVSIGANCDLAGTYIGYAAIGAGAGLNLDGRMYSNAGAISLDTGTYVRSATTSLFDLGILDSFALFTKAGAISNTIVNGNVGNVCTGLGVISGFASIVGRVYGAEDGNFKASFEFAHEGIPIVSSLRYAETVEFRAYDRMDIGAVITVDDGDTLTVNVETIIGDIVIGNASVFVNRV